MTSIRITADKYFFPAPIFGTMERDSDDDGSLMYEAVKAALEMGYRRFDLAERYATANQVGRAISESKVPREELFIISKVDGLPTGNYEDIKKRVAVMLKSLPGIDQFDLLLIHHPLVRGADLNSDPDKLVGGTAWQYFQQNIGVAWENMSRLKLDGLCAEIGVSNFYLQHLGELDKAIQCATDPCLPREVEAASVAAVEIYIDCTHPEEDLVKHCQNRSPPAAVLGYRPLAFLPVLEFLDCEVVSAPKENSGASVVEGACATATTTTLLGALEARAAYFPGCSGSRQLVLASLLLRGVSPVASSMDKGRIASNFAAVQLGSTLLSDAKAELLVPPCNSEQAEMIIMMGGSDEYAAAFASMGC